VISCSKEILNFHINFSFIHILWAIALSPRPLGPWVITTLGKCLWIQNLVVIPYYYLGSFNMGYIIFRNVEIFGMCFFSNNLFRKELMNFFFRRQLLNFQEYSIYQKDNLKISWLFEKHVSKVPKYYGRHYC
jgi:hypothetical protein